MKPHIRHGPLLTLGKREKEGGQWFPFKTLTPAMYPTDELIPTDAKLLDRLRDSADQEAWQIFFDTYQKFIYKAALKAGLSDAEAQDAVQETVISVLKAMPGFTYHPHHGSVKSWLLKRAGWRTVEELR